MIEDRLNKNLAKFKVNNIYLSGFMSGGSARLPRLEDVKKAQGREG